MKFNISEISNDDISVRDRPTNLVFDSGAYCQQRANHIVYRLVRLSVGHMHFYSELERHTSSYFMENYPLYTGKRWCNFEN